MIDNDTRPSSPAWRRSVIYAHVSPEQPTNTVRSNTMKIDAQASDIFQVINDALQFASSDPNIPAIAAVRIESTPNDAETVNVLGVATDRFVLGVSRITAEGDAGLCVTISADDAKNVLRIAKTAKRDAGWRRVTIEHNETAVSFAFSSGENITVCTIDAEFPRWRQLLIVDPAAIGRPAAGLGVDPLKLAQFARIAAAKTAPMQLYPGINDAGLLRPIHVRIGDDFYGLVMPVKAPGGQLFTHETPGWLS